MKAARVSRGRNSSPDSLPPANCTICGEIQRGLWAYQDLEWRLITLGAPHASTIATRRSRPEVRTAGTDVPADAIGRPHDRARSIDDLPPDRREQVPWSGQGRRPSSGLASGRSRQVERGTTPAVPLSAHSGPKAPAIPIQARRHSRFDPARFRPRSATEMACSGGGAQTSAALNQRTLPGERQVDGLMRGKRPFKRADRRPGPDP